MQSLLGIVKEVMETKALEDIKVKVQGDIKIKA